MSLRRFGRLVTTVLLLGATAPACYQVLGLGAYTDGVCLGGTKRACYGGPEGSEGKGICRAGTETCADDNSGWSACEGEVLPAKTEDCTNKYDDDCNGKVNDHCDCVAGTKQDCYTGPAGTEKNGLCHAGTQTCLEDGTGFGECTGEQTPKPEDCTTAGDDDCDGVANQASAGCVCTPNATTSCYTGPAGTEGNGSCKAGTHTCDPDGKGFGACTGDVLPGVEDCSKQGDEDCDGFACSETMWAKRVGSSNAVATSVAVDGSGNVFLTGLFPAATQFGATTLVSSGDNDIFIAKLDASGNAIWAKSFGGAFGQAGAGIAVDATGNIAITGTSNDPLDFGCGTIPSGMWVAKLDPSGACLWSVGCTSPGGDGGGTGIAIDGLGNVVVAGLFSGGLDCGSGSFVSAGGDDIFVTKFAADGTSKWTHAYGDAADQHATGVAVDAGGNVIVTGTLFGSVDLPNYGIYADNGNGSAFAFRFSATGGPDWIRVWPNSAGESVAIDSLAGPVLVGALSGTADFGGGNLSSAGLSDIFVVKLTAGGDHVWSKRFGDGGDQYATGVGVDPKGNVTLTGGFESVVNFGGASLTSAGKRDIFIATLDDAGNHRWSRSFGGTDDDFVGDFVCKLGLGSAGEIHAVGYYMSTSVDFGTGPLTGPGDFLVKIAP